MRPARNPPESEAAVAMVVAVRAAAARVAAAREVEE